MSTAAFRRLEDLDGHDSRLPPPPEPDVDLDERLRYVVAELVPGLADASLHRRQFEVGTVDVLREILLEMAAIRVELQAIRARLP